MPLYMDIHTVDPEVTWEDVARAHYADTEIQDEFDAEVEREEAELESEIEDFKILPVLQVGVTYRF